MKSLHWDRMIALVDMNAFFASVEQGDHPEWQALPVAITNGVVGSTIITCSYEARAWGVKTGMRLKQARQLCPGLIQAPARPERYAEVSTNIMHALTDITPDIEVFSVDEAFLDLTGCQNLWDSAFDVGMMIKTCVNEASGVLCSVGISGDKTTSKYAAKLRKPDGLTVIPPWDAEKKLSEVPVKELCGINHGIGNFLAERGVFVCGDMKKIPVSVLGQRFGNPGRRIWLMAQGKDPEPLALSVPEPKSIGHGKVIPLNTKDRKTVELFYQHMSEKVAARLRKHQLSSQHFYIALYTEKGWLKDTLKTAIASCDGAEIYALCKTFLSRYWKNEIGCFQVQVTATRPLPAKGQMDFLMQTDSKKEAVNAAMDKINQRYGEFCIAPAPLLNRSSMPNVIAPAWKPTGHRQTIEKTGGRE
ncbi:DNA polymerase Y family protein [Leucothrix pacifica]|nr:DNA polymerase IV [Leucothrix pacifica]